MLMLRDQPEYRIGGIKTAIYFAEYFIQRFANLFDRKIKQWCVVSATLLSAMHSLALGQ